MIPKAGKGMHVAQPVEQHVAREICDRDLEMASATAGARSACRQRPMRRRLVSACLLLRRAAACRLRSSTLVTAHSGKRHMRKRRNCCRRRAGHPWLATARIDMAAHPASLRSQPSAIFAIAILHTFATRYFRASRPCPARPCRAVASARRSRGRVRLLGDGAARLHGDAQRHRQARSHYLESRNFTEPHSSS